MKRNVVIAIAWALTIYHGPAAGSAVAPATATVPHSARLSAVLWRELMQRPPRGPLNSTPIDEGTDTYDTIDWMIKNVPHNNGRVGMFGTSYPGWLVVMAVIEPHPALKAVTVRSKAASFALTKLTCRGASRPKASGTSSTLSTFKKNGPSRCESALVTANCNVARPNRVRLLLTITVQVLP